MRALGLAGDTGFQSYQRLLNRARWSARAAAGILLRLLVAAFVPTGPVILGLDETVERRRGAKLTARAIYRDAARSSRECFQKTSGLRWLSLHLPAPVTLITRLRLDAALYKPAPARTAGQKGRPRCKGKRLPTLAKRLTEADTVWSRVRVRWDGGTWRWLEAASDFAVGYHSGLRPVALRWVLIRDPKGRFEPQALLSTDPNLPAAQIINAFVRRWTMEVTFQEARAHLGIEGQRQWNDLAIARTTPLRLALFSLVALLVQKQPAWQTSVRQAAWYKKALPTFSDALAQVRRCLWRQMAFCLSPDQTDTRKPPATFFEHLGELLADAA